MTDQKCNINGDMLRDLIQIAFSETDANTPGKTLHDLDIIIAEEREAARKAAGKTFFYDGGGTGDKKSSPE